MKSYKNINDIEYQKANDEEYLKEMQQFLDMCEWIKDSNIRDNIIKQALKCDSELTNISKRIIRNLKNKKV